MIDLRARLDALGYAVFKFYNRDTKPDNPGPGEGDIHLTVAKKKYTSSDVDFGHMVDGRCVAVRKIVVKVHWMNPAEYMSPEHATLDYYALLTAYHDTMWEEALRQALARLGYKNLGGTTT
jgi:hypothetical protein